MGGKPKLTHEGFLERATQIHGTKYDYSEVVLNGANNKVDIICKLHGVFPQTPSKHLNSGMGCPHCAGNIRRTTEWFIKKATSIHGDKYQYSKVDYKNSKTGVIIMCPKHGEFSQNADDHITRGSGCALCAHNRYGCTEHFIDRANELHNSFYNYSKFEFITAKTKSTIICPAHGEFQQTPDSHNQGSGCPQCWQQAGVYNKTTVERNKADLLQTKSYVYTMSVEGKGTKVGISYQPEVRLSQIRRDSGHTVILRNKYQFSTYACFYIEQHIHNLFNAHRNPTHPPYAGHTEVFDLNSSQVAFIEVFLDNIQEETWQKTLHGVT